MVLLILMLAAISLQHSVYGDEDESYDLIVVGAGSAGAIIASRLAERRDFNVLLIEAGGDATEDCKVPGSFPKLPRTRVDWNMTSEDGDSSQCGISTAFNLTSGHVLGGGSSINYLHYVRGVPADYKPWAEKAKDQTWNWEGIYPYFLKSEKIESKAIQSSRFRIYHGQNGPMGITREERNKTETFLKAFGELHDIIFDINGEKKIGYTKQLFNIDEGVRQSTEECYLKGNKKNLRILKDTLATQILLDTNNTAFGVKTINNNNVETTYKAKKEIIISAGTMNSAKLLMLSGIGPKDHLNSFDITVKQDLPVGYNYQDHVLAIVPFKLEKSDEPVPPPDPTKFPTPSITGYVELAPKNDPQPEYQTLNMIVPHDSPGPVQLCSFNLGYKDEVCDNLKEGGKGHNTMLSSIILLHPESRGRVVLRSTDPKDPPLVCTGTFAEEIDLEVMTNAIMDHISVLNTTYFKSVNAELIDLKLQECGPLRIDSRDYWKCYINSLRNTIFHFSGTNAMGSVVDSNLRVFGVKKLRVADASVMPTMPSGNINAVIMMIGEKVADMIKSDHPEDESSLLDLVPNLISGLI